MVSHREGHAREQEAPGLSEAESQEESARKERLLGAQLENSMRVLRQTIAGVRTAKEGKAAADGAPSYEIDDEGHPVYETKHRTLYGCAVDSVAGLFLE